MDLAKLKLGIDKSPAPPDTKTFLGTDKPTENLAPTSEVEQPALTPDPGKLGTSGSAKKIALCSPWDLLIHNKLIYVAMAGHHQQGQFIAARHPVEAAEAAFAAEDVLALDQRGQPLAGRRPLFGGRQQVKRQRQTPIPLPRKALQKL